MRIAKYLAQAGVASRRQSEEFIRNGRVCVNGQCITDPATNVDPDQAQVTVDGNRVSIESKHIVVMLNKPAGVVSTVQDTHNRPTVIDFVKDCPQRLYPVGRLDIDTTGLILLTNDGELTHHLTHPRFHIPKTYRAQIANPPISKKALNELRSGVTLEDGKTAPAAVIRSRPDVLIITLYEGKKRQVKRMCEAVGHPVIELHRFQFGPIKLGSLPIGKTRILTSAELQQIHEPTNKISPSPTKIKERL